MSGACCAIGGPDGEGLLIDGPVGLGHRRLTALARAEVFLVFLATKNLAGFRKRLRGPRYTTES